MFSPAVQAFFDPQTSTLSYVVSDPSTGDAIIIDPVLDYDVLRSQTSTEHADELLAYLRSNSLVLRAVLETHAHADHLSGAQYIASALEVPVAIGAGIVEVQETFAGILNLDDTADTDGRQFDLLLLPDRDYEFGSLRVKTLSTPGHTPACLSYLVGDAVFTGDSLFIEDYGTGRTDFPAGSSEDLYHSVTEVLYKLPGETRVFVGHDYQPGGRALRFESTIARERVMNVQLSERTSREAFVEFRDARDSTLKPPRLIFQSIQVNAFGGRLPEAEENGRRYLKIPLNLRQATDSAGRKNDSSRASAETSEASSRGAEEKTHA